MQNKLLGLQKIHTVSIETSHYCLAALIIHEWIILCKFSLVIEWFSLSYHVARMWGLNCGVVGGNWDQAQ